MMRLATLAALFAILPMNSLRAAGLEVRELRIQEVDNRTYFHVRFVLPADYLSVDIKPGPFDEAQRLKLAQLPQFVPQDGNGRAVYQRLHVPHHRPDVRIDSKPRQSAPADALEDAPRASSLYDDLPSFPEWATIAVELDFAAASKVASPTIPLKRDPTQSLAQADLEGLWAEAQANRFAVLEALTPGFSFYGFACAATGRKYGVADPALDARPRPDAELLHRQLYETTTGASAIAESLQMHRLLQPGQRDKGQRIIDLWNVPGIMIAEHPWEKMMAGAKPAPEPLAQMVPRDNYYLHFKNIRKFLEFGEIVDQWGTTVSSAYEIASRDYDLRKRYERQLCLRSSSLGKTLGPALVRSLAVTGSDSYLREGSDVTVLFQVSNKALFLAAVNTFIAAARTEWGKQLTENTVDYHGVAVETFVTPFREVSLYRASLGEFVIYSNSPTGLRRVLDAHQGRLPALADALDYQYMRTVFRLEDDTEDGFAFLSDAFIRQLVGPASKIKEKRRLEALTSLTMLTNAALFTSWQSGNVPVRSLDLLLASSLKPEDVYAPEGRSIEWDSERRTAVSEVYNTLHFATPLIELPIDMITRAEEQEYGQFRNSYLNLWRQYFDPVGMRFSLNERQIRLETYILPLITSSEYSNLRSWTGGGTISLDPATISPRSLLHFTAHLSPDPSTFYGHRKAFGDWVMFRVDDAKLNRDRDRFIPFPFPTTVGVHIGEQRAFDAFLKSLRELLGLFEGALKEVKPDYNGIRILCVDWKIGTWPALYSAQIDGAWYLSTSLDAIHELADQAAARRAGQKPATKGETVAINSSLYLAPGAAVLARPLLRSYLEWESHRRAFANLPIWYALYRTGLVDQAMSEGDRQAVARRFLGYLPVSPDGSAYRYHRQSDEVSNDRHGSGRRPTLRAGIEDNSPLGRLLDQIRTVRADLRFREDGVHTTVTIERKSARK